MTDEKRKLLKALLKDAIKIQHRFDPEPKLNLTGTGTMRSEGTEILEKIKAGVAKTEKKRSSRKKTRV